MSTCTDGIANGTELGVDCGGSCAAARGKSCATSPLCVIGVIPINEGDNHLRLSYYLFAPPPRAPPSGWSPQSPPPVPVPLVQGQFQYASTFPVPVSYASTLAEPYHLECFGSCVLFAPLGRSVAGAPRPAEAAVMRRTLYINAGE